MPEPSVTDSLEATIDSLFDLVLFEQSLHDPLPTYRRPARRLLSPLENIGEGERDDGADRETAG